MERLSASDTATLLGLKTPNLKHYAELLEQNGLNIYRDAKKHRFYTREDIKILKAMIYLNKEKSMLLEDAASFVMSSDTDIDHLLSETKRNSVIAQSIENNLGTLDVLLSILNEQKAMREDFMKREQSQYEAIKAVETVTLQQHETIKEVLETVKQQTATIEGLKSELEAVKEQNDEEKELSKKSFWAKIFRN